jgi:hypothetical protein
MRALVYACCNFHGLLSNVRIPKIPKEVRDICVGCLGVITVNARRRIWQRMII